MNGLYISSMIKIHLPYSFFHLHFDYLMTLNAQNVNRRMNNFLLIVMSTPLKVQQTSFNGISGFGTTIKSLTPLSFPGEALPAVRMVTIG